MRKFILFFAFVLVSWVSFAQFMGVIAQAGSGGTPAIDYSLANAGFANLKHTIDKTGTGVNGEPETIEVANGEFFIAPSGTAYNYSFTEGDVSSLVKGANTYDANQSRNMLHWAPDGLALYTANFAENVLGYVNGTVPFSPTGRTYLGTLFNLTADDSDGRGYIYNSDGTKIWMQGVVTGTLFEYDVVPAYTGSTSVTQVASYVYGANTGSSRAGIDLSPDEKYIVFTSRGTDEIGAIKLSTAGTLADGVDEVVMLNVNWWTTTPYNIKYSEDGRYLYILDTSLDIICQVDLNNQNTYGPELVTNGDFSGGSTGWTLGSGWTVSGGEAIHDGTATSNLGQNVSLTTGSTYVLQWECTANVATGSTNPIEFTGQTGWSGVRFYDHLMEVQKHTITLKADATTNLSMLIYGRVGQANLRITNISLREVTNK